MPPPAAGDRILVLKDRWLHMILNGEKTMEIRGCRLRPGRYLLGSSGLIRGEVLLHPPLQIKTEGDWASLRPLHCVLGRKLPYKKTWGIPVSDATNFPEPVPYNHPRGAVGIVVYRGN